MCQNMWYCAAVAAADSAAAGQEREAPGKARRFIQVAMKQVAMKTGIVASLPLLLATIVLAPAVIILSLLALGPVATVEVLRDAFGLRVKRAKQEPATSN